MSIVTGGGAGIGRALAKELACRGSRVIIADVREDTARRVAADITERRWQAAGKRVDVSKQEEVTALINDTVATHGQLDYLFNNAAVGVRGEARDLALDEWRRVFDVNLYGVLYGTLASYGVMVKQGFGHIVNMASAAGLIPQPGFAPYSVSKHGVVGLSLALRFEGVDLGVKVSVVCPGDVRTNLHYSMARANGSPGQVTAGLSVRHGLEPVEAARLILKGVAANRAIIVFPSSIIWRWRMYRLAPGFLDAALLNSIREFRKNNETCDGVV